MVDESQSIYPHFGGTFSKQTLKWTFPSGATVQFMALPDDLKTWQGLQATMILIDEMAEFTLEEIQFLRSRLRSARYKGRMMLVGTCNPRRESFLFDFVKFSLDDDGVPAPGTEHRKRFFAIFGAKTIYGDSEEDVKEQLRLISAPPNIQVSTYKFIPMTIVDNPVLIKNNPGYLANLQAMSKVDQARFLRGSWTAKPEGEGYFRREWLKVVDFPPPHAVARVRSWDLAASEPSESNRDPDWSAGVKLSRDKYGVYYIEDSTRFRKSIDNVIRSIIDVAYEDDPEYCTTTIPKDPGQAARFSTAYFVRTLAEAGVPCKTIVVSGHQSKVQRFLPFCSLAESGGVRIVRGDWNEDFLTELENFTGGRNEKNDQVDACSDAFNTIAKSIQLPTFVIPNMTGASPIPTV